jgi:simple sugar transport system substrate-binding protein
MQTPNDESKGGLSLNRRRTLSVLGLSALGATAVPLLDACSSSASTTASSSSGGTGGFGKTPSWKFVMVNHATTNSFFTPTVYGMQDAGQLFGVQTQWTGSATSEVSEMTNAFSTALNSGADGIACSLIDETAFNSLIARATAANVPVIGYSSDAPNSGRLAYVGTDNTAVGQLMGERVVKLVGSGDIAMFAAEPTASYAVPRIQGLQNAAKAAGLTTNLAASGFTVSDSISKIQAFYQGHPTTKGLFGLDAYATQAVGQVIKNNNLTGKVIGGGYDALGPTLDLVEGGYLDFTIDEQAYLQGFIPIAELFLLKTSGGQSGAADVNPGIKFVDKASAPVYTKYTSRFEGTSSARKVISG